MNRKTSLLSFVVSSSLVMSGCGAHLFDYLRNNEKLNYQTQCSKVVDFHKGEVLGGRYFEPQMLTSRWQGSARDNTPVKNGTLVEAIRAGKSTFAMVMARGGLGKTRLTQAIKASLCGQLPVFTIDLHKDIAKRDGKVSGNPFVHVIAERLGLPVDAQGLQRADALLKTHPWVLLADSIEEVDLNDRPQVAIYLAKLRRAYPSTARTLIFARPPVLEAYYGFGDVDTVVHIDVLSCDKARKVVSSIATSKANEATFWGVVGNYNFDIQLRAGLRCVYPYMSTYRDIQTLYRLAVDKNVKLASHADAHQRLIALRLQKELQVLNWTEREVLDMVDRMYNRFLEAKGGGAPSFDIVNCLKSIDPKYGWTAVDAGLAGTPAQRRRQVCEKALQSVVFEKTNDLDGEAARWSLSDPDMVALFKARWLNSKLASMPSDACQHLSAHKHLVQAPAVLHYTVAQPVSAHCLAPTLRLLCEKGAKKPAHLNTVVKGLPFGQLRFQLVEEARAYEAEHGKNPCVMAGLDIISKTLTGR